MRFVAGIFFCKPHIPRLYVLYLSSAEEQGGLGHRSSPQFLLFALWDSQHWCVLAWRILAALHDVQCRWNISHIGRRGPALTRSLLQWWPSSTSRPGSSPQLSSTWIIRTWPARQPPPPRLLSSEQWSLKSAISSSSNICIMDLIDIYVIL